MNYLAIYYDGQDGETKAIVITNEDEPPHVIPGNLVADGVISEEGDVNAIVAIGSDSEVFSAESGGTLMIGCNYDEQTLIPIANTTGAEPQEAREATPWTNEGKQ